MVDRINPDTGIVEEQVFGMWEPKRDESGEMTKIDHSSGEISKSTFGVMWDTRQSDGNAYRINTDTGAREASYLGLSHDTHRDASGQSTRFNKKTGIIEKSLVGFHGGLSPRRESEGADQY